MSTGEALIPGVLLQDPEWTRSLPLSPTLTLSWQAINSLQVSEKILTLVGPRAQSDPGVYTPGSASTGMCLGCHRYSLIPTVQGLSQHL